MKPQEISVDDDYEVWELEPTRTVAQLIEALAKLPPDALVTMEGCDCCGFWNGNTMEDVDGNVLLCRRGGPESGH